ncbi:hypothetical protein POM88_004629 [Heracleum sosnowskyi]|uniref:Uncharacterized protein n=1 Tax=Heracleum sosnowskyi TaxID=360622 RepID=A0AAD8JIR7_9APIA|nr:hypothetical protein POM88_004629 [Heracleum sosnowskyi]
MSRAKAALNALPPKAGDDFEYASDDWSEDLAEVGPSSINDDPDWLFASTIQHGEVENELLTQYNQAKDALQAEDTVQKHLVQQYMSSLKLQKLQLLQIKRDTDDLQETIDTAKDRINEHIERVLPEHTAMIDNQQVQTKLLQQLLQANPRVQEVTATKGELTKGEQAVNLLEQSHKYIQALEQVSVRMPKDVATIASRLEELQKQLKEPTSQALTTPQLSQQIASQSADNKKGEKITQAQGVPSTEGENMASSKGEPVSISQEDSIASRLASLPQSSQTHIPPISATIRQVLTPTFYQGEPSFIHEFKSSIQPAPPSPPKDNGKNKINPLFPQPKPDETKVSGAQIKKVKESKDFGLRSSRAIIKRNGYEICICASHPYFTKAKAEELARMEQEGLVFPQMPNEDYNEENAARLADELGRELEEELLREAKEEAAKVKRKGKPKTKTVGRKPRTKQKANRPVSPVL